MSKSDKQIVCFAILGAIALLVLAIFNERYGTSLLVPIGVGTAICVVIALYVVIKS